jgi:hypothetical protein
MGAKVTASAFAAPEAFSADRDEPAWPEVAASSRKLRLVDLRPMAEHPAIWLDQVAERIRFLQGTGFPFSRVSLAVMKAILRHPIFEGTPMPLVSPSGEAGISAEFRGRDIELQIEVDESGVIEVYALHRNVSEWDGLMEELPGGIETWAWRLAQDSL